MADLVDPDRLLSLHQRRQVLLASDSCNRYGGIFAAWRLGWFYLECVLKNCHSVSDAFMSWLTFPAMPEGAYGKPPGQV